jgi:ribose 5-phosphate isomerase RpiB
MRIAVGSDHAGSLLQECLSAHLSGLGHDIDDLGTEPTGDLTSSASRRARCAMHVEPSERGPR